MQLHLLDYNDEEEQLTFTVFNHDQGIRWISPCPSDEQLVVTHYRQTSGNHSEMTAKLWKLNNIDSENLISATGQLESLVEITDTEMGPLSM